MTVKKAAAFFLFLIFLPGCATTPKPAAIGIGGYRAGQSLGVIHQVEPGQTLLRIAQLYRVDPAEILRVNEIHSPSHLDAGQKLFIPVPSAAPFYKPVVPIGTEWIQRLVGPRNYAYAWKTITVHHSATAGGSAALFDRDHRRRKMGGLFYHFVIGNGRGTPDGAVEVGWRWREQVKANRPYDIQICLVGNFDKTDVSKKQMDALVGLIQILRQQYGIPTQNIRRHNDIPGKHTDCPGSRFPFHALINRLNNPSIDS